jgi:hypothetical protein
MVWDVKPDSKYGYASGADQISRYTLTGEYVPGTGEPLFGTQPTLPLTGAMNRYEFRYGGNGLVVYRALDKSPMERALEQNLRYISTHGPSALPARHGPLDPNEY